MKHRIAVMPKDRDPAEDGLVHYEGCGMVSTQTLCGHVDQVSWSWQETTKHVNCVGCIAVRNHVLGRT